MINILAFGSCRLSFNLDKYNIIRPQNLTYIHTHNEVTNIINNLKKINNNNKILSKYSKLQKLDEDTKKTLFKQIELNDIILLELCSKRTFYEYENNKYKIVSKIYEYLENNSDYIVISNTSQKRNHSIQSYYFRKDNIKISSKSLYDNIKLGNYLQNKKFLELTYNQENENTIIKISNMPNNYFNTFSIVFDIYIPSNINFNSYTIKCKITSDFKNELYVKYYNGTEYIYTDQKINDNILLNINQNNSKKSSFLYNIGFYRKNDTGEIMTSNMLKNINEYIWNFNLNIKSYEIIINELDEIDKTLPKKHYIYKELENEFIDNFNKFLNHFKNKKIVIIPNLSIIDNNEEIIPKYVNESRLKYINFLKEKISKIPNCYFFENYVTNELLDDQNHYNKLGYKKIGEKLEKFLEKL